jgi:hypothetical protein
VGEHLGILVVLALMFVLLSLFSFECALLISQDSGVLLEDQGMS